jgi:hypothetical protein
VAVGVRLALLAVLVAFAPPLVEGVGVEVEPLLLLPPQAVNKNMSTRKRLRAMEREKRFVEYFICFAPDERQQVYVVIIA